MTMHDIGIIGLGVMGQNLALNFAGHGIAVAGFDQDPAQRQHCRERSGGQPVTVHDELPALCAALALPRRILLLVPAGAVVDQVLAGLQPLLAAGDVVIDGGNSDYRDTARRLHQLAQAGVAYVGLGISGGREGALHGPSLMPGGTAAAWPLLRPLLLAIAAKTADGSPCCDWLGPDGAGHFVKMVHNGIEYADMQLLGECFALLQAQGQSIQDCADLFEQWNRGPLQSYLLGITADILRRKDPLTGQPLLAVILDSTAQKGSGNLAAHAALDYGVPAQTLAAAVFTRYLSARKDERVTGAGLLPGPAPLIDVDAAAFIQDLQQALYVARLCIHAQGFQLLQAASRDNGWQLDPGRIAGLWRAGCIINARMLDTVKSAFDSDPTVPNLLHASVFRKPLADSQSAWRHVVAFAAQTGIAVPAFAATLSWYDACRTATLPANLLQAQRDFFGAHGYERSDQARGRLFHTEW